MKRLLLLSFSLVALFFLGGCVSYAPTIPAGYTGPRSTIRDTALVHGSSKVDFFTAEKVNGSEIEDSATKTRVANQGRGFMMSPEYVEHEVPAGQPVRLEIRARTSYAAPILELTLPVYQVKGEVSFTPEAGHTYAVKGQLGENYSAVWVEDTSTQQVVDRKIEVNGSAKLGFWSK